MKVSKDTCSTIITPRVIALVFNTSGKFVSDLVGNKILNYSLEICRDVVNADLALERGETELGDPFFAQWKKDQMQLRQHCLILVLMTR